jgi:hypothetical protein
MKKLRTISAARTSSILSPSMANRLGSITPS